MLDVRKREIRIKADSVRENCKIGKYGILDLFKECEKLGYKLIRYPIGKNAELGFATIKENDTIVFTNTSSRLSREIFTLAHEIGHIVLHLCEGTAFVDDSTTISGKTSDEKEQEANYFAACLLVPSDELAKFLDFEINKSIGNTLSAMDVARIMSEFQVSFDMALNRLENTGIISAEEHMRLDNERNYRRVGNLLKSVGGNASLNMASESISIPYEYIEYVIYNYNHNAVPIETLEKVLECYHLSVEDIADKLIKHTEEDEDMNDLIGGLPD